MNYPQISVIIVVYNGEEGIQRSIESVINQTFYDWELIIVDDGSTDGTSTIIDEFARLDKRITAIHKTNGGVSLARQVGLNNANGKYIIYQDADDWTDCDMLECMYAVATNEDSDMVICDISLEVAFSIYVNQKPSALDANTVQRELFLNLHGSCCNKLVRRKLFNEYKITFPEGLNMREDLFVNVCLLNNNLKVSYVPKALYHYNQQPNHMSLVREKGKEDQYRESQQRLASMLIPMINENNKKLCKLYFSNKMVLQAFNSRFYSSWQFFKIYHQYALDSLRYPGATIRKRILLFLSCVGFYRVARRLADFKESICCD